MKKEKMVDLAQRQLDAYNERDLDAFCACYHSQVQIHLMLSGKTTCTSMEQFREIYHNLFSTSPNLHCELKSRIVLDAAVIDEEFVSGSSRYPDGVHALAIYGFRDGLIDRIWFPR